MARRRPKGILTTRHGWAVVDWDTAGYASTGRNLGQAGLLRRQRERRRQERARLSKQHDEAVRTLEARAIEDAAYAQTLVGRGLQLIGFWKPVVLPDRAPAFGPEWRARRVAILGSRTLHPADRSVVEKAIHRLLETKPKTLVFSGEGAVEELLLEGLNRSSLGETSCNAVITGRLADLSQNQQRLLTGACGEEIRSLQLPLKTKGARRSRHREAFRHVDAVVWFGPCWTSPSALAEAQRAGIVALAIDVRLPTDPAD